MKIEHRLRCEASICQDDNVPGSREEVIWYADEEVCNKKPYKKFQKKQRDIQKWFRKGKFKNWERGYTADDLENCSI